MVKLIMLGVVYDTVSYCMYNDCYASLSYVRNVIIIIIIIYIYARVCVCVCVSRRVLCVCVCAGINYN